MRLPILTINYDLDQLDARRCDRELSAFRPAMGNDQHVRQAVVAAFSGPMLIIASGLYLAIFQAQINGIWAGIFGGLWIVFYVRLLLSRRPALAKVPADARKGICEIDPMAITWTAGNGDVVAVQWSGFSLWRASEAAVLLLDERKQVHCIPLSNPIQDVQIVNFCNQYLMGKQLK